MSLQVAYIDIRIEWVRKKVKQSFMLKSKNAHPLCVIYEGTCVCSETYIYETRRNARIRWDQYEDPKKECEPAKHLRNHTGHSFSRKTLLSTPASNHIREIMEASIIALNRPTLNPLNASVALIQKPVN